MPNQMTLKEVLEDSIQKEIASRFLYVGLRQRVRKPEAKEAFQSLADQEETHQRILEEYLQGKLKDGAIGHNEVIDYRIADHLEQPEISPRMELKDVFLLAADREKAAHDLYSSLAEAHPDGQIKHLLSDLANQELEHKKRIETLYTEVAFPQTDGG